MTAVAVTLTGREPLSPMEAQDLARLLSSLLPMTPQSRSRRLSRPRHPLDPLRSSSNANPLNPVSFLMASSGDGEDSLLAVFSLSSASLVTPLASALKNPAAPVYLLPGVGPRLAPTLQVAIAVDGQPWALDWQDALPPPSKRGWPWWAWLLTFALVTPALAVLALLGLQLKRRKSGSHHEPLIPAHLTPGLVASHFPSASALPATEYQRVQPNDGNMMENPVEPS